MNASLRPPRAYLSAGFTLLELLMVACLIPLISFAVYANFNSGIKIWQRLHQQTNLEDLSIFSQKTSRYFENAFFYAPIPFEGDKESVAFGALIETDDKLGGDRGIGKIRFFYDPSTRSIKREQLNMSELYQGKHVSTETMLHGASDWKVSFFAFDKLDKSFQWYDEWSDRPKELPVAVRFEFNFFDGSSSRSVKKTFMIPAGGSVDKV